jgi:hypothetical protein
MSEKSIFFGPPTPEEIEAKREKQYALIKDHIKTREPNRGDPHFLRMVLTNLRTNIEKPPRIGNPEDNAPFDDTWRRRYIDSFVPEAARFRSITVEEIADLLDEAIKELESKR